MCQGDRTTAYYKKMIILE